MGFSESLKGEVKRKAHFRCCLCHALGVEIHHIIPEADDGPDTEDNAAPLCPSCHETYGSNPQKRKFIREARDFWYEVCAKRFAADGDRLEEIASTVRQAATKDDLANAVDQILAFQRIVKRVVTQVAANEDPRRSEDHILDALEALFDKVWYDRHMLLQHQVEAEGIPIDPEIWKGALEAAERIRTKYGQGELGPRTDFEWGMLSGKLSALRWVLGDDWDMLDT